MDPPSWALMDGEEEEVGEVVGEWMKDTRYTENFYTRYTNTVSSHPTPHPTPNSSKFKARVEEHALNKRISLNIKMFKHQLQIFAGFTATVFISSSADVPAGAIASGIRTMYLPESF